MHSYTIQVSFPDHVSEWLNEQAKNRLVNMPEHRRLSLMRETVRDIIQEIVGDAAEHGVHLTGLTSRQKEEVEQIVMRAMQTGSV